MVEGHYIIGEDDFSNLHHEHVQATAIFESEEIVDVNEEEEKEEHLEHTTPLPNPNMSNDKEVSTKTHSFITIPFEMRPKLQFFNVSKSHLLLKASRIDAHKVKNLGTIVLRRSFEASKLAT
jgi:hypothetical protein